MKFFGIILLLVSSVFIGCQLYSQIASDYTYENHYSQYWHLADKSSTIQAKQQYIHKFVAALEEGKAKDEFASNDAKILPTPNNSFDANLQAVKSLAGRLDEIQKMSPTSFEYNTAIQQITAQEQGQATDMLHVLKGCYELGSYPIIWDWYGAVCAVCWVLGLAFGVVFIGIDIDFNSF